MDLVRQCLHPNPQERPTAAKAAETIIALESAPAPRMQASCRMIKLYECLIPG